MLLSGTERTKEGREGGRENEGGKKGGTERDRGRLQEGGGGGVAGTASPNQFLQDRGERECKCSTAELHVFFSQPDCCGRHQSSVVIPDFI